MEKKLIDVSQHNGNIDWNKVKSAGIDYAILRIGWIGNSKQQIDTKFNEYYNGARAVGIDVGVYVYNYAKSSQKVIEGANWVVNLLKDKPLQLPVYFDIEDDTLKILGKDTLTQLCVDFNGVIEKSGRWAGVYANKYWYTTFLHYDLLKAKYTLWLAQYANNHSMDCDIWQYSEKGSVYGISGYTDMNIIYRDLVNEIKGTKSEPVQLKSTEEIVQEVIDNKWGTGEDRKNRLEAAGYNYTIIQNRVNEMLKNNSYYPACNSKYTSLVDALNSIGVDSSFNNRKAISQKNNVRDYTGTADQNNQILSKLKAGRLKK